MGPNLYWRKGRGRPGAADADVLRDRYARENADVQLSAHSYCPGSRKRRVTRAFHNKKIVFARGAAYAVTDGLPGVAAADARAMLARALYGGHGGNGEGELAGGTPPPWLFALGDEFFDPSSSPPSDTGFHPGVPIRMHTLHFQGRGCKSQLGPYAAAAARSARAGSAFHCERARSNEALLDCLRNGTGAVVLGGGGSGG